MEGALMEKLSGGTISSKWRSRWCRVDAKCFYFGENKDSIKVNTIPLGQIRELKQLADPKRFDMVLQDDSVQSFLAASKGEAKRWIRVIKDPLVEFPHVTVACPLARGVMAADANGFSDPFCNLLIEDQHGKLLWKMETQKIMKTLDPVWDHVFYVSDELALPPQEWSNLVLHFEVFDWDAVGSNDFLGQVKLPLGKFPQGSTKQEFFTLEAGQGVDEVSGQIKIGVCWETPEYLAKKQSFQFGRNIQALTHRTVEGYNVPIPEVLLQMQDYLLANGGLEVEGIFRLAPDEHAVDEVKAALNERRFTKCNDVNCVSHLLKVWCRDLPHRLMEQVDRAKLQAVNDQASAGALLKSLADPEASILSWFIDLCVKVSSREDDNKMNSKNLAIVFAPNLGPRVEDPLAEHVLIQQITAWLDRAIQHRKACGPETIEGSVISLAINKDEAKSEQSVEELVWAVFLRQLSVCRELGLLPAELQRSIANLTVNTSTPAGKNPKEWVAKAAPDTTPFFFNPASGETAWTLPPGAVVVEAAEMKPADDIRPNLIRPRTSGVVLPDFDEKEASGNGAPTERPPKPARVRGDAVRAKSPGTNSRTLDVDPNAPKVPLPAKVRGPVRPDDSRGSKVDTPDATSSSLPSVMRPRSGIMGLSSSFKGDH